MVSEVSSVMAGRAWMSRTIYTLVARKLRERTPVLAVFQFFLLSFHIGSQPLGWWCPHSGKAFLP
jgi:hypothetical protein